jgi:hypothetical protein
MGALYWYTIEFGSVIEDGEITDQGTFQELELKNEYFKTILKSLIQ